MDIMSFFSIDNSIDKGSLFIKTKSKTFSKDLQSDKFSNDLLMKQILNFFEENNLKLDDISKIYVNQGPGNFSGLRSSLAIAKGMSISKNLNLYGYDTFIWSCVNYFNKKDSICSLLKFREKYFIKNFGKNLKNISKVREITVDEIIEKYSDKFKVIPKNTKRYFDDKILKLKNLTMVDLDHNNLEFLQLNNLLNNNLIKPLYLS